MKYAVCIVSPPGYIHSEAFREVAETLHAAGTELGHDVVLTTRTDLPGRRSIILGSNLLIRFPQPLRSDAILYNLEQVQVGPWFDANVIELFRRYQVWDYSHRNALELESMGLPRPQVVPIGWSPVLRRIEKSDKDIDVLFYGSLNERRNVVINELRRSGIRVETIFGAYGQERDRYIARARIVLNVHFFEARVFEIVRVAYLLANGCPVVSERGASVEEEAPFEEGVAFADYDKLASRCLELLDRQQQLDELARNGQRIIESRPATGYLEPVLSREAGETAPSANTTLPSITTSKTSERSLPAYYEWSRPELVARVEAEGRAILDVGCAAGAMGRELLAKGAREVVGLEIVTQAANIARSRLTAVYRYDLNALPELPYPEGYFNILTFADVLEHLVDPEAVLRHLLRWLRPGGEIVCSIPNIRHESVLLPLLVDGSWNYVDAGILDRTHLRFYTLQSILKLFSGLGLVLQRDVQAVTTLPSPHLDRVCEMVGSLGGNATQFRQEATAIQYLVSAKTSQVNGVQLPKPIADPWRGSRPTRLLLAPRLDDGGDCWQELLCVLAEQLETQATVTVGVALPLELLRDPPPTILEVASRGTLDLLVTEAPGDQPGWERLLGGASSLFATSDWPTPKNAAAKVGIDVVEAAALLPERLRHRTAIAELAG